MLDGELDRHGETVYSSKAMVSGFYMRGQKQERLFGFWI